MKYFLPYRHITKIFILLLLIGLVTACAAKPMGRSNLLSFIEDGKTTREQTFLNLGEPSATFDGGRILCFRLGQDAGGYFVVLAGGDATRFMGINNSLVMIFDERGLLSRHALVQVKAP